MQLIDKKNHGYIDYCMGIILIAAAYLLNFQSERTLNIILFVAGSLGLLYSLLTKYKMGVIKIIPINIHLMLDTILGTFLAASPWLFGFADKVFFPHLVLGLIGIGVAVTTSIKPQFKFDRNYRSFKRYEYYRQNISKHKQ